MSDAQQLRRRAGVGLIAVLALVLAILGGGTPVATAELNLDSLTDKASEIADFIGDIILGDDDSGSSSDESSNVEEPDSHSITDKAKDVAEGVKSFIENIGAAPGNVADVVGDAVSSGAGWLTDKALSMVPNIDGLEDLGVVGSLVEMATMPLSEVVKTLIAEIGEFVASMMGSAAAWVLTTVIKFVFWVSSPDLGSDFVYEWAGRLFGIAIPITLLLAMWQLISGSIKGSPGRAARQALFGATTATVGTMIFIPIVAALVRAVDAIVAALMDDVLEDTDKLSQVIADIFAAETMKSAASSLTATTAAPSVMIGTAVLGIILFIFSICVVVGGIILLIVLAIRTLSVYVVTAMMPVALSGLTARISRSWARQAFGWLLALIVSKLAIVIVLGLGVTIILHSSEQARDGAEVLAYVGDLTVGGAMVLVAVMAPAVCFKFFDFLGEEAVAYAQRSLESGVRSGAKRVGATVKTVAAVAAAAAGGAVGGAGASASSSSGATNAGAGGSTGAAGQHGGLASRTAGHSQTSPRSQVQPMTVGNKLEGASTPGAKPAKAASAGEGAASQTIRSTDSSQRSSAPGAGRRAGEQPKDDRRQNSRDERKSRRRRRPTRFGSRSELGGFGAGGLQEDDLPGWEVQ